MLEPPLQSRARLQSIVWKGNTLRLLDQRRLPFVTEYVTCDTSDAVAKAIENMVVRGAPAIGVAAAFGMVLAAQRDENLVEKAAMLKAARPTAVNLMWAVDKMQQTPMSDWEPTALALYNADVAVNQAIGQQAQQLIPDQATVMHHCNTGSLATVDYGTALGAIRIAHEQGKQIHAILDETRPRLQGARLSAYECQAFGIPHTVIVDGAAPWVMKTRRVDLCIVGCDRVAANGDVANKIGTYALALAAKAHNIPFYVACPLSTLDLDTPNGEAINIEERSAQEITHIQAQPVCPEGTPVYNPAFDITPAELVTAIITEQGIISPPYLDNLKAFV
ncbi:S-methyl-5-thioribose-1-phosphate isomerase [Leptolyngbya cf. ectocarpi LEGE 11479]|uniref:Methylthioribose-1-phosphate isomerase n=1 Tax=Leptolyngbya cf. ectocarpi LEGE 11479 TaxID=1828722 RepID=A0A928X0L8_LEPEC|nr:S-methyl-5-thioribose-1-phosphate isomerase [Leptolyngbya ectocarpi]MBE9066757.1 S-methyl-5-thioribose-1-phosphate isomerase [Leptolyngbya cf. ectocarpi LEGE 11479]